MLFFEKYDIPYPLKLPKFSMTVDFVPHMIPDMVVPVTTNYGPPVVVVPTTSMTY